MAINNIGTQGVYSTGLQQTQQGLRNLFAALKSGDMPAAQKAYKQANLPVLSQKNTTPLGRLYQALRNEDLAGAQKAGAAMQPKASQSSATVKLATSPVVASSSTTTTTAAALKAAALELSNAYNANSRTSLLEGLGTQWNRWG
jgi:hypothetical protein